MVRAFAASVPWGFPSSWFSSLRASERPPPTEAVLERRWLGAPPESPIPRVGAGPENLFSEVVRVWVQGPPLENHLSGFTFPGRARPGVQRNLVTLLEPLVSTGQLVRQVATLLTSPGGEGD